MGKLQKTELRPLHIDDNGMALGSIWGDRLWDQDLTLMHELTLWSPLFIERYFTQPRHSAGGEG